MISFYEEKVRRKRKHCKEYVIPCATNGCKNKVYTLRLSHINNQRCLFCNKRKIDESYREAKQIDYYAEIRY